MVIETIGKDYRVAGKYACGGNASAYLCANAVNDKQYIVLEIPTDELDAGAIDFLYRQTMNQTFSDLADCFVDRKTFYVAFVMHEGQPLANILRSEKMSLAERLFILRKMVERTVLQNAPCFFQMQCLRAENVFVTRDLDTTFLYGIDGVKAYADIKMRHVQLAFHDTVELVFREELKTEVLPPIKDFLRSLKTDEYADCLALFRQLMLTGIAIMRIEGPELEKPKTLPFRIWERLKKGFKPLKRVFAIIILVAVFSYMIFTFKEASGNSAPTKAISHIGTLEIVSGPELEQNT